MVAQLVECKTSGREVEDLFSALHAVLIGKLDLCRYDVTKTEVVSQVVVSPLCLYVALFAWFLNVLVNN